MTTNLRHDDKVLLVKIDHSAALAADHAALYERTRKWWKASTTQVQPVRRVLAIVSNKVLAAYEPYRWEVATTPDLLGRVAFHGDVAPDASLWLDTDVSHLFPQGAANPIRYTMVAALMPAHRELSEGRHGPKGQPVAEPAGDDPLIVLLRINQSWQPDISTADL